MKETCESWNLLILSGNLLQSSKSQGKVRKFCFMKFNLIQFEDPNFELTVTDSSFFMLKL